MLVLISAQNMHIYNNLAQAYEAGFSSLTKKMPNEEGLFELDTIPLYPYRGYLLYHETKPIGFCVLKLGSEFNDVAEFYIIPVMRKHGLGASLAHAIFDKFPGTWHVRQIAGADSASAFWRRVITQYTDGQYIEEQIDDPDWGVVTRQKFTTREKSSSLQQILVSLSIFPSEEMMTEALTQDTKKATL
jgi:predicted acetyltransferase